MTLITFQDGKAVMRDGRVGTEQACCCNLCSCSCTCDWTVTLNGIAIATFSPFAHPIAVCHGDFRNKDRAEYAGITLSLYDFVEFSAAYTVTCAGGNWNIAIDWYLLSLDQATQVPLGERVANTPFIATASIGTRTYSLGTCDSNGCPTGALGAFTDSTIQLSVVGDADCEDTLSSLSVTATCNPLP